MSPDPTGKSRHFDIDVCPTREATVERLVKEYRLNKRKSHQAVYHPDTAVRWIKVENTRGDFSVRFTDGKWKIRIRKDVIQPPRPAGG